MNLVLIGYRGTGKSTVAKLLAKNLGMATLGMDAEIVARAGMAINDLVAARGWDHFRDLETAVAQDFAARENIIIDCGGGVIVRQANADALKTTGRVYWLKASIDLIVERIGGATDRPSLTGEKSFIDEIAEVLAERTPLYAAAADIEIELDGMDSATAAGLIATDWTRPRS